MENRTPADSENLPATQPATGRSLDRPRWQGGPGGPAAEGGGVDWRRLGYVLWRRKWWIVLLTVLGVAAGWALSRQIEPVYATRGTLWLEREASDRDGPIQGEEVLEGQGWSDLFVSFTVLEPVVHDLRLYLDPRGTDLSPRDAVFSGFTVEEGLQSGTYELSVGNEGRFVLRGEGGTVLQRGEPGDTIGEGLGFSWRPSPDRLTPGTVIRFDLVHPRAVAARIRRQLAVEFNPTAGNLMETQLEWHDPREAAQIHRALMESFLATATDLKNQKLREVADILDRQESYAAARLDSAELALQNFRVETITLPREPNVTPAQGEEESTRDPVFQAYFSKKLEIDQLQSDLSRLRGVLQSIRETGEVDALAIRMIPATSRSPALEQALDELRNERAQLNSLLATYTRRHPSVETVERRIESLTNEVIPQRLQELVQQLESQIASLQSELQNQGTELQEIPTRTIQEARLRRNLEMAEKLHSDLLSRLKEAELAAATNLPNLQIVDRPTAPTRPTNDRGSRVLVLASLAGMGLGVGGVLFLDRIDNKVQTPEQVIDYLGLPVLAMIPRIEGDGKIGDDGHVYEVLESFRTLRGQISRSLGKRESVILVTSPSPRDGKSLVAANLAISFASSGRKTLLVDGDTRRGNAERLFDLPPTPGLTELLKGNASLLEVGKTTEMPGLVLLPHGTLRNFNADLLDSPRMDDLLEAARNHYDIVIIDAPPLVAGIDALLLGEKSDKVVMVCRTGATDRETARAQLVSVGRFDLPVLGAVLNDVPGHAPYYRSSYYSYPYEVEADVMAS